MSALLIVVAALSITLGLRELWAERGERARRSLALRLPSRLTDGAPGIGGGALRSRIALAGLAERLDPRTVIVARVLTALASVPVALMVAPLAPGSGGFVVVACLPLAAALSPDLVLRRLGLLRLRRISDALPAALELMANGAGSGASARRLLGEAGSSAQGPLSGELRAAVAALECGTPHSEVMSEMADRGGGSLASLALLLERSRRLGVPLAAGLDMQAEGLREEAERRIEEHGARAAPKIQLVVALILVPSVLLIVAAAVIANSDHFLAGL